MALLTVFFIQKKSRPTITLRRKGYQLKTSEVACFASHYELWVRCVELDEPIVILEDNVDPVEAEASTRTYPSIDF